MNYSSISGDKLESAVSKKGFRQSEASESETVYSRKKKRDQSFTSISRFEGDDTSAVIFQTTSTEEFENLKQDLTRQGFKKILSDDKTDLRYQFGNTVVKTQIETGEQDTIYHVFIQRKKLPALHELIYAEDLLQLNSHEYISFVFGPANVKQDVFYFSETETNTCTVIYPNTNSQVIVVWEDQKNLRNISFMLIGGSLKESEGNSYKQIEHNKWHSRQGVFLGMSLNDLVRINGENINLFGFETDQPGFITINNRGRIDFDRVGIQFNCLDCHEDRFYTSSGILNSGNLIRSSSRAYIKKLIILPPPGVAAANE
jgi:hypothetical protein